MSSGSQGYTDEVATEVHDLMDQVEHEDERVSAPLSGASVIWQTLKLIDQIHPERYSDDAPEQVMGKKVGLGSSAVGGEQRQSTLDKVKQTLSMNK